MSDVNEVIRRSPVVVHREAYCVARVAAVPAPADKHFLIARDANEITIITEEANLPLLSVGDELQGVYTLVEIEVATPFQTVGFLAAICRAIADAGLNILVISTYSRDYVLLGRDETEIGVSALRGLGFPIR